MAPAFMQTVKHSRTEGVARTDRTLDESFREVKRSQGTAFAVSIADVNALRHMHSHEFHVAETIQRFHCRHERRAIQRTALLSDGSSDSAPGLDFVKDQVIGIFQCRRNDMLETVALFADNIETRLYALLLERSEKSRSNGSVLLVSLIHPV